MPQLPLVVTYATHSQGQYEDLVESYPKIHVGGWGSKWNGFMDKFHFMIDFLSGQSPSRIVIFLDGFDTVVKGDPREAVARFESMDCKMLISTGLVEATYPPFIRKRVFATSGIIANSGLYMGYAGYMKEILERATLAAHDGDDQKGLNIVIQNEPCGHVRLDTERYIFCNLGPHERSPEVYDAFDTIFLGFNAKLEWDWNCTRKMAKYVSLFYVEFLIIFLAALAGVFSLQNMDRGYNCSFATEVFGVFFPLFVVVMLLNTDAAECLNTFRLVLGMAVLMLSFHVAFFCKKNISPRINLPQMDPQAIDYPV